MSASAASLLALAMLPQSPLVDRMTPPGAQRGRDVTVEFAGQRLHAPQGLLLSRPGLEVVGVTAGAKPETCSVTLRIAADCAPGAHPLRLCTADGLGNTLLFQVGVLPELAEKRDGEAPMRVPLDCTVNGAIGNEDVDRYEVELPAGTRVQCEVAAVRLGRALLDLVLTVHGPDGRELARSDDPAFGLKDPLLAFVAATAGVHTLTLRTAYADAANAGSYRLHVGTFPRPTGCLPCGGAPGEEVEVRLLGDGALAATTLRVRLPVDGDDPWLWHPEVGGVPSPTPIALRVGGPPNRTPRSDDQGRAWVEWPASVHGVVAKAGEPVRFYWQAKKGVELEFRCFARALRSPLDAVLLLRDANDRVVASNDDTQGLDPVLRFAPPADGAYVLEVRDVLRRAGDDRFFRIEGAPRSETASLRQLVGRREDPAVVVPRAGQAMAVLQWNGFDPQDLQLAARELPAGVSATFGPFVKGSNSVPVLFTAAPDAALAATGLAFELQGAVGVPPRASGFAQPLPLVYTRNDQPLFTIVQPRLPLAVAESLPFALQLEAPRVPIVRGAPLALAVHGVRSDGFAERIALRLPWAPPGLSSGQANLDPANDAANVPLSADANAATGRFPLAVVGETRVRGGAVALATGFVELQVDEPWLTASSGDLRSEPGKTVTCTLKIAPKRELPGPCRVHLLGLPRGASADDATVAAAGGDAPIPVRLAADAAIGRHRGVIAQIFVPANAPRDGAPPPPMVEHRFALGELRIDAPAVADAEVRR